MEKLIVCSVVDGRPGLPAHYAMVQAWGLDSFGDNLRRQRRELQQQFLPVAAFTADPEMLKAMVGLHRLPSSLWLPAAARWFGRASIDPDAEYPILRHLRTLDGHGAPLLQAWQAATRARDVRTERM